MKKTIALIVFTFLAIIVKAESAELYELVHSAKSKNKLILLKVLTSYASDFPFDLTSYDDRFIKASLYASNPSDLAIINEYKVEIYPSIILLNSNGHLILPVKSVNNLAEIETYLEKASKMEYESKPIAQFDLEYKNNKMNKTSLYEYISKRTSLGLDNSEIIDKYTLLANSGDLLNKKTILLFIDENNFNIPGSFCSFLEQNHEKVKEILRLSDDRFHRLAEKSVEYNFQKICKNNDESALSYIIDIKANVLNADDKEILRNEYLTRYFHTTYQPLKVINHAREYANAVLKYNEQQEKAFPGKNRKLLFSPSFKNSAIRTMCASKLRDAAQYVVEVTSAKSALTDALDWSIKAEQLANEGTYNIYETQAYIMYKLGKKDDAITNMEKAYNSIPHNNTGKKTNVGINLIKMKRGEKIY